MYDGRGRPPAAQAHLRHQTPDLIFAARQAPHCGGLQQAGRVDATSSFVTRPSAPFGSVAQAIKPGYWRAPTGRQLTAYKTVWSRSHANTDRNALATEDGRLTSYTSHTQSRTPSRMLRSIRGHTPFDMVQSGRDPRATVDLMLRHPAKMWSTLPTPLPTIIRTAGVMGGASP